MYKVGYNHYGIEIIRIHKEFVEYSYSHKKWTYYPNQYYILAEGKLWFFYEYELNTIIGERKYICKHVTEIVRLLKIKLMLD